MKINERYAPTVEVVRQLITGDEWIHEDGLHPERERAPLFRGVPMVGDRVEHWRGKVGVVKKLVIRAEVKYSSGVVSTYDVDELRPATQDAEVEAMLSAFVEARAHKLSDREIVKSVREALDRVRENDHD